MDTPEFEHFPDNRPLTRGRKVILVAGLVLFAALVLAIVVEGVWGSRLPARARAECLAAYARARSRHDTAAVDRHFPVHGAYTAVGIRSYDGPYTCGLLRMQGRLLR